MVFCVKIDWMYRVILAGLIFIKSCDAQVSVNPRFVTNLPSTLNESSGLVMTHTNLWWSHNDSGGDAELYGFDTLGNLVKTVPVPGAANVDWEDLAYDPAGRLFVGDFGNNNNDRQDLVIYWFDWDGQSVTGPVNELHFSYPDQTSFPASANFNMEAFFYRQDSLFLFSKNKTTGGTGYSKIYRLPVDTGTLVAELLDSIQTGPPVTSADISPDGEKVLLMSYGKMILFYNFTGSSFWQGDRLDMGIPLSQSESIAFASNTSVYFTNEQRGFFEVDLDQAIGSKKLNKDRGFLIYPNPADGWTLLQVPDIINATSVKLINNAGQIVLEQVISTSNQLIPTNNLVPSNYLMSVLNKNGQPVWTTHLFIF